MQNFFVEVLLNFWNLHKILSILKHNMAFISSIFPKLLILESVITVMPENVYFKTPFGSERAKRSETLLNFARQNFYAKFQLIWNKLSCVSCVLVACEILGPFFKMLTVDHICCCHNWEKFLQEVQVQLSSNFQIFSSSVIAFLKST